MTTLFVEREVVEFTGLPQSPDLITAADLEACHVLLVGERERHRACAASRQLRPKSQQGGVAGALQRASGRSALAWKPILHYYSHKCSCHEHHVGSRVDVAVHYRIEVSSTLLAANTMLVFNFSKRSMEVAFPVHPCLSSRRSILFLLMFV